MLHLCTYGCLLRPLQVDRGHRKRRVRLRTATWVNFTATRYSGSLLLAGIEVEPSAGEHPFKQLLQLLWWGPIRVRPLVAHKHYPRPQPTPHSQQRHRPAQWALLLRASLLDLPFFPYPLPSWRWREFPYLLLR